MEMNMKLGLLKLMKEAEKVQAQVSKMEAEAMLIMAEAQTIESKQRINEINTSIAMQRERREGIIGSIETMAKVYEAMKPEPQAAEAKPKGA